MTRFLLWAITVLIIINIWQTWGTDAVFGWLTSVIAWTTLLMNHESDRV